jgi:hypothetical protein
VALTSTVSAGCEGMIAEGTAQGGLELDGLVEGIDDDFRDSFEDDFWDGIMDLTDDYKYRSTRLI